MTATPIRLGPRNLAVLLLAGASLAACATPQPRYSSRVAGPVATPRPPAAPSPGGRYKVGSPYQVSGVWYVPREQPDYDQTGIASWYGDAFQMKPTANGEIFDMNAISAAHTTLPLPSIVEVTNLDNGRKLQVRVNDRGPFVGNRLIDLSRAAAQELGYDRKGLARVRVRYVGPADLTTSKTGLRYASQDRARPTPYAKASARRSSGSMADDLPQAPLPRAASAPATASLYRVQAGAFSDRDNARKVAAELGGSRRATIETTERRGEVLYRVMLPGGVDEDEAWALRDRIAELGYADARVIRPF